MNWLEELKRLADAGTPHVLVTVAEVRGSAPREAGAKMVVTADGFAGTIGGGHLEHKALELARRRLRDGGGPTLESFPLGPSLGQCCGGHVGVLFEPLVPRVLPVVLFGAGHVGKALVHVLDGLDCRVTWIDGRADEFPAAVPANVTIEVSDAPVYDVAEAPARAAYLVMTHSHDLDQDLVEAILRRGDFAYCGLIGSATKRARFEKRLANKGLDAAVLARLTCPIGLAGVTGKKPQEIAIAVAARLLQLKDATIDAGAEAIAD